MTLIIPLDQITAADARRVGGKSHACARLKQAGFPVPEGAAVATEGMGSVAALAELDGWLSHLPAEALLAVRSSAADEDSAGHSFAGIHETRLNVPRHGVPEAVRACWSSIGSPRALDYRRAVGLPTEGLSAGVLVQVMVQPVAAGVAFTIDPVTGAHEELVISASWGLGEALVSGLVDSDEFRVRKSDGMTVKRRLGTKRYRTVAEQGVSRLVESDEGERTKPSLSEEQVGELARLLVGLEQHFGAAQDVEWCHDGRQFWILQSRPVTTAARTGPEIEWTRANVREVLPDLPSHQTLDVCIDLLNHGFQSYYGRLLAPEAELGPCAKSFYGRLYFNLSQLRRTCELAGIPPAFVMRAMGHVEEIRPEDEIVPQQTLRRVLRTLPDMLRLLWLQFTLRRVFTRGLTLVNRRVSELAASQPERLSNADLWGVITCWRDEALRALETVLAVGSVGFYELRIQRICRSVGFPYERLLLTQVAVGEESVSARQAFDLLALAQQARREEQARGYFLLRPASYRSYREELQGTRFLRQFDQFLESYGHRGEHESDWALPRYREDPTPLLRAVQAHVEAVDDPAPGEIPARLQAEADQVWQEFVSRLNRWQRLVLVPLVQRLLGRMKRMYLWREQFRSEMMRAGSALRRWHLALAERFVAQGWLAEPEDYFCLTLDEVGSAVTGKWSREEVHSRIASRKTERAVWARLEMPLLMRESALPALIRQANSPLPETEVSVLQGLCISPGRAEGEVVVLREPTELGRMKRGAVLVAPATDPGWTPLFTLAAGVIVEVGGTLSHAATVAREYGLPALANVKDATRLLKDGDRVALDATAGFVQVRARALSAQKHAST